MRRIISFKTAANFSIGIYSLFIAFHFGIILGILFFDFSLGGYLWGGQMKTDEQLLLFEFFSLVLMGIFLLLTLIHTGKIKLPGMKKAAKVSMWLLFVFFLFNTLGNIVAVTVFERTMAL